MGTAEVAELLTERQRRLVDLIVDEGKNTSDAAQPAGYSPENHQSARNAAYKALKLPHVQAYMFKRVAEAVGLLSPKALGTLDSLLGAKSEYVRMQTAQDLLDRAGFKAPPDVAKTQSGSVSVTIDLS